MADLKIIVLEGDDTGQGLLEEALRVLDPSVTQVEATFERHDLSLENRRATDNEAVLDAARAMTDAGFGLKAPTVTPEGADDVGSPNRILREQVDGKVIIRTGRRIPGVSPFAGVHFPISVCRMAVGDAYGAKQWRERDPDSDDELAFRTERISRSVCRATAEYAFRTAAKIHGCESDGHDRGGRGGAALRLAARAPGRRPRFARDLRVGARGDRRRQPHA